MVDYEGHQQHVNIDHLLPAPMSTTPVSEPLTVDSQVTRMDPWMQICSDMLSLPIVDSQILFQQQLQHKSLHMLAKNHNA